MEDYLKKAKTFLDANTNTVLILIFTNPDEISVKDKWKLAFDNTGTPALTHSPFHKQHTHYTNDLGITPLAFVPKSLPVKQSGWPTLGEMIDSGKRVIVFLDSGADTVAVDFILPEFQMVSCSHDVVLPFIGR